MEALQSDSVENGQQISAAADSDIVFRERYLDV
jgi:hypothetical protein